jgi:histidinol-phosphatase (PHP family)
VHYVSDSWAIDDPQKLSTWNHRDAWEVWSVYFDRLTMAASTGFFEIIGHADLPKKFGHRPDRDCTPLYETFLNAARKHNCALDINTAGLRKDCREIYPNRQLLELAFRRGMPITFGSDAHAPEEVGMNFAEAMQLARGVGYRECLRFQQRKSSPTKF